MDAATPTALVGLTDEEVSEAHRLLLSGEPAHDPRVARLVVALAQDLAPTGSGLAAVGPLAAVTTGWATVRLASYPLDRITALACVCAAVAVA
jgi:hypothetical protein